MTAGLHGVVVCHGDLARALVSSVEEISGIRGALVPVSNVGCDRARLEQRIQEAVADRPALVFVDLPSGSCLFAAARGWGRTLGGNARVVTGVNLPMLIDFVFHRELPLDAAAERAAETGGKAILVR
jgi:mannose/fructose-specific phosphotransferase system component IIA